MTTVHTIVPDSIDDPARPSGGNTYDRRICDGLDAVGWLVYEHTVAGSWPQPDAAARATLSDVVAGIPDGAVVLIDGLIASTVPEILVPQEQRLQLVVLVHMPLEGDDGARERAVLTAAAAVVTTSDWTRRRLLDRYALRPELVHVAEPGVDPAELVDGTATGGELICVAAVTPNKGHATLLAALSTITDLPWCCVCVGALDRDPDFADRLIRQAKAAGIEDRVRFAGALTGRDLDAAYAAADVLVLASRAETYGMVVTEALARGLPVIATDVGGLSEAMGSGSDGSRPGLLVPADDPDVFGSALRGWLIDADLRKRLRHAAEERRATLTGWSETTGRIAAVLAAVAA